jgi:PKD repeat protein
MTRRAKSAIIFGAVAAVAVGIGITIALVYNQTMGELFQRLTGKDDEDSSSGYSNSAPELGYLTRYKAILTVGEEGTYNAYSKFGKAPFSFEWKFSDGVTLTGEKVTRSFNSPGNYTFHLTITDGTGEKVTSTELYTNVVQEKPKEQEAANATRPQIINRVK